MGKGKTGNSNADGSGQAVSGVAEEGGLRELQDEIARLTLERDAAVARAEQLEQKLGTLNAQEEKTTYPKLMYSQGGGYVHAYNFNQERDLKAQGFALSKTQW